MGIETGKNIPYLDGWRGVAILFVLLAHFGPPVFWWMGRTGVVLFFVLSGLFMGRILFIKKVSLASFFARRISRIVPTTWLFLTVMYVYARYAQVHPYPVPLSEFVSALFFLSTYLPQGVSIWADSWPNGHMWSLNVEEHSYLYLAAGTFIIAKSRQTITPAIFLVATVALVMLTIVGYMAGILHAGASPWGTHTEVAALGLVASAMILMLRNGTREGAIMQSPWIPLVSLGLALALFRPDRYYPSNASVIAAPVFAAIAVNYADNFPGAIKKILALAPLRWCGTCSFSLYLWQQPYYLMTHAGASKPLMTVLAIATGTLSFYCFENPVRKFLNRQWTQHETRRLAAGAAAPAA